MSIMLVIHAKRAFSDIPVGFDLKKLYGRSSRVLDTLFLLCLQFLT